MKKEREKEKKLILKTYREKVENYTQNCQQLLPPLVELESQSFIATFYTSVASEFGVLNIT